MASTNMTEHLKLNQWIGSDKPKMADFNADNRKVDQAVGSHTADQTMHLTEAERAAWNKAIPIVGGYTGDGTPMRAVEMGVAPRFGIQWTRYRSARPLPPGRWTFIRDFFPRPDAPRD